MVKCSKAEVRRLRTALRWKLPSTQRERMQMVLLRESGMMQPAIAAAMGVSLSTVNRAHMAYDDGGIKALKPKANGGRKRENMTVAEEKVLLARFAHAAARPRQTGDEATAKRVRHSREHDRDDRGRLFHCENRRSRRDNDIDLEPDELGGDLRKTLEASLRPANLDRDGAALDPAEFAQPLHKSGEPLARGRRRGADEVRAGHQSQGSESPRISRQRKPSV
jgi:transposase